MAFTPTRSGRGDKYAGLETSDLTRLKQLEAESARKDRVIARLTTEVVRELIAKNGWGPCIIDQVTPKVR